MEKFNDEAMRELQRCLASAYKVFASMSEGGIMVGEVFDALPAYAVEFARINNAHETSYTEDDVAEYGHIEFVKVELAYHDYMLGKCGNWS